MYKEFYGEPPFHHHHHMGPMEHEHIANAAAYARLNTKLSVHMNDDTRHITNEEREKWNEAADNAITDVDEILAEKADVEDIPTKLSDLEDDKGFITQIQFGSIIDGLNERFIPYSHLSELLVGYVREEQLGQYIKNTDILFTYGGSAVRKGDSITPASGGESIHVDPYVLPVATATALGGIKVGTSNASLGNNKYPVQLTTNQVAYVYVPASSGSGGEMTYEYIPTYSINILSSTMHRTGTPSRYTIEGRIEWQVVKNAETSSIVPRNNADSVSCEVWMANTQITSVRNSSGTPVGDIGNNTATHTYYFDLGDENIVYINNASTENAMDVLGQYVNVRLYKLNTNSKTLIASVVVPVRMDGQDGAEGQQGPSQSLNFEVLRLRHWASNPDPAYNNGSVVENGVKYIDIVSYNDAYGAWGYYRCTQPGTTARPVINADGECGDGWSPFTSMGDAAFDVLLANSAYINSLTAKQVVVTNNSNNPVAGMVSGTYIPTELGNASNPDGIRIFAGALDNTGNLATAPFTVDSTGHVKANDAELKGSVDATAFKVIDSSNNPTIKFTTFTSELAASYPNISTAGLSVGDPVGLVYDPTTHQPKYFFDFAPVNPGTFSATEEVTYKITQGANTGTVNILFDKVFYKVTDSNDANYDKYITSPRANGQLASTSEPVYERFSTPYLVISAGNNQYRFAQCTVWKRMTYIDGVKSVYTDGSNNQYAYIVEGTRSGNNISAYTIQLAGSTITSSMVAGADNYTGSCTYYLASGASEVNGLPLNLSVGTVFSPSAQVITISDRPILLNV